MAQNKQAGTWQEYDFPVELVWRALTGGATSHLVDPLEESEYDAEPKPGTVYTRSLGCEVNQRLAFEIKTHLYTASWEILLQPTGRCKTKVSIRITAKYNSFKALLLGRFGLALSSEIHRFLKELDSRLRNVERQLKMN